MRGNPWQTTAIVAIILVVVLLVPLIAMGVNFQKMAGETKEAKDRFEESAREKTALQGEIKKLKELTVGTDAATLPDLEKERTAIMEKVLPGEDNATRTYHDALNTLGGHLERERAEHRRTKNNETQHLSDLNAERDKYAALEEQLRNNLREVEAQRDADIRQYAAAKAAHDQQLKEAQDRQEMSLARAERVQFELSNRVRQLEDVSHEIREKNLTMAEELADIKNPNVEHPAGRIISVDQRAGTAIINLGRADGLLVRMMFSVYHSSITGLSFHTTPIGRDPTYCDVCKREVARDIAKASIEVMRILGPHRAEVRILDDILTDPIMTGDVIYSPIWRPGQRLRFALTAGMHLPGSSIESGTEAIIRLIEMNGGVVDCWVNESAVEGEDPMQGEITDLTNFIVVNERIARELDPEVARVHQGLVESARNRAIKAISLEDLLSRMAWRNMTPVYIHGSQEFTPDMRVIPQHQGAVRQSSEAVSPIFTPDGPTARVNAFEANPVRSSSGITSPLFDDKSPPPPASGGRTSDLFRPRSPATGQ